jgi:hypothetical protein
MKKLIILVLCISFLIPILPAYSDLDNTVLLRAVVEQNGAEKWGYVNLDGEFVIEPLYDTVNSFTPKGIALVIRYSPDYETYKSFSYFINRKGKIVSGPFDGDCTDFDHGYAIVNTGRDGSRIVDEEGNTVFISKYVIDSISEEMVCFHDSTKSNKYGYMDMKGKVVIPPGFMHPADFENGYANVTQDGERYYYIDKKGNIVKDGNLKPGDNGNEIIPFLDEKSKKYGYKFANGKTAIEPKFEEADRFIDGRAIVTVNKDQYDIKCGVINTKGEYVIKPDYTGIHSIGQGFFAVNNKGYSKYDNYLNYPNAVFNSEGKQLSDFVYYNLESFNGEYASACNETQTFFMDKNAQIVKELPVVEGIGTLKLTGDIIESQCDGVLSYYRRDGSLIWKQNTDNALNAEIKVIRSRFRPNFYTYIEYPAIQGLQNSDIQEKTNKMLEDAIVGDRFKLIDDTYESEGILTGSYSVKKNRDLVTIQTDNYFYPLGAAHGMPYKEDFHINIKTGEFYVLKDLFKKDAKYKERLTDLVRNQIALNSKITDERFMMFGVDKDPVVSDTIGFTVTEDVLKIYFSPYEIACYAMGFVTFEISYGQIADIINTKGTFWNSFDKKVVKSKEKNFSHITDKTSLDIQNSIKSYEKMLIEAINSNDFKKVEPVLFKGSSLYNDQQKLVKNLNKQGIKEKLNSFEIFAIGYIEDRDEYRVYVIEDIGVLYPAGKDYVSKKFNWCYSVKLDRNTKSYKLSRIDKW